MPFKSSPNSIATICRALWDAEGVEQVTYAQALEAVHAVNPTARFHRALFYRYRMEYRNARGVVSTYLRVVEDKDLPE